MEALLLVFSEYDDCTFAIAIIGRKNKNIENILMNLMKLKAAKIVESHLSCGKVHCANTVFECCKLAETDGIDIAMPFAKFTRKAVDKWCNCIGTGKETGYEMIKQITTDLNQSRHFFWTGCHMHKFSVKIDEAHAMISEDIARIDDNDIILSLEEIQALLCLSHIIKS